MPLHPGQVVTIEQNHQSSASSTPTVPVVVAWLEPDHLEHHAPPSLPRAFPSFNLSPRRPGQATPIGVRPVLPSPAALSKPGQGGFGPLDVLFKEILFSIQNSSKCSKIHIKFISCAKFMKLVPLFL
jgi:hypothetical protein